MRWGGGGVQLIRNHKISEGGKEKSKRGLCTAHLRRTRCITVQHRAANCKTQISTIQNSKQHRSSDLPAVPLSGSSCPEHPLLSLTLTPTCRALAWAVPATRRKAYRHRNAEWPPSETSSPNRSSTISSHPTFIATLAIDSTTNLDRTSDSNSNTNPDRDSTLKAANLPPTIATRETTPEIHDLLCCIPRCTIHFRAFSHDPLTCTAGWAFPPPGTDVRCWSGFQHAPGNGRGGALHLGGTPPAIGRPNKYLRPRRGVGGYSADLLLPSTR